MVSSEQVIVGGENALALQTLESCSVILNYVLGTTREELKLDLRATSSQSLALVPVLRLTECQLKQHEQHQGQCHHFGGFDQTQQIGVFETNELS